MKVDQFSSEPVSPDFVHTSRFVLIDKKMQIRGYYNGLDSASLLKLAKDVGYLMLEKDKTKKNKIFQVKGSNYNIVRAKECSFGDCGRADEARDQISNANKTTKLLGVIEERILKTRAVSEQLEMRSDGRSKRTLVGVSLKKEGAVGKQGEPDGKERRVSPMEIQMES